MIFIYVVGEVVIVRGRWSRIVVEDCGTSPFGRCGTRRAQRGIMALCTASVLMCFLPDFPLFAKVLEFCPSRTPTDIECTS